MSRRTRCRAIAFQVLFQDDLNPKNNPNVLLCDEMIQNELKDDDLIEFARSLVTGVRLNRTRLDETIQSVATNWSIERMAVTDRNILRLGVYELFHSGTPGPVVVNEAINLAKRFGTNDSSQFVNGVLDRIMRLDGYQAVREQLQPESDTTSSGLETVDPAQLDGQKSESDLPDAKAKLSLKGILGDLRKHRHGKSR